MRNKILYTLGFALFVVVWLGVMDARADSHAAVAPSVLESYACSYKPGKDREDLDKLRDFYLKQAEKAGIAAPPAWLWTLNKGAAPVNFVWLNVHESLTAFGGTDDAIAASPEMAEAFERADTVMACQAGLGMFRQTYGGEMQESDSSVVSFGCGFREGSGPATMDALHAQIADLNEMAGDLAVNSIFEVTPGNRLQMELDALSRCNTTSEQDRRSFNNARCKDHVICRERTCRTLQSPVILLAGQ